MVTSDVSLLNCSNPSVREGIRKKIVAESMKKFKIGEKNKISEWENRV